MVFKKKKKVEEVQEEEQPENTEVLEASDFIEETQADKAAEQKDIKELKAAVEYYQKKYQGVFMPDNFMLPNPAAAEANNIMFGILTEIRKGNELLAELVIEVKKQE